MGVLPACCGLSHANKAQLGHAHNLMLLCRCSMGPHGSNPVLTLAYGAWVWPLLLWPAGAQEVTTSIASGHSGSLRSTADNCTKQLMDIVNLVRGELPKLNRWAPGLGKEGEGGAGPLR